MSDALVLIPGGSEQFIQNGVSPVDNVQRRVFEDFGAGVTLSQSEQCKGRVQVDVCDLIGNPTDFTSETANNGVNELLGENGELLVDDALGNGAEEEGLGEEVVGSVAGTGFCLHEWPEF